MVTEDGRLFPGERVVRGAGLPALAFAHRGDSAKPLAVLLPGGGHLGRIFYGHPDAPAGDFVVSRLVQRGFGALALSYPSAHPAIGRAVPKLTVAQWSDAVAAIVADHVAAERLRSRVVVLAWSLAGRVARNLAVALRAHGIDLDLFVGLSAVPPMPGFGVLGQGDLRLAPTGLLDGSSEDSPVFRSRERHLAVIDRVNRREILSRRDYARLYVTDSPIGLRGEAERYVDRALVSDIGAAVTDQGTFDFGNYPLCAVVSASDSVDAVHALTDAASWGMVNAKALFAQRIGPALAKREPTSQDWAALRSLMDSLPGRLSRYVEGGHLFFVGEKGAAATADHVQDLIGEAAAIRLELARLLE